ncbi:MAG: caspase family protein [Waddliaceae bacterium]
MRKVIILLIAFLFPFLRGECADVIAILCCDTCAEEIGDATCEDLKNMRAEVRRIAMYTESDLKEVVFEGQDLFPAKVMSLINGLSCHPDDIIIFYFTGHGYRTSSKEGNPWPNLFFTISKTGVDYDKVGKMLISKKPRLLWTIADCCNNYAGKKEVPFETKKSLYSKSVKHRVEKNYKKLFLESDGLIMIASSEAGGYSWCNSRGALYTCALLESIQVETHKHKKVSWEAILERSASSVSEYQKPFVVRNAARVPESQGLF